MVLQLRHDQRHQAVRQRRVDQVLVGAHALHVGGARARVDGDDAVEAGHVEPGAGCAARGRNRFEVRLASRTGWPGGIAAYDARSRVDRVACVASVAESVTSAIAVHSSHDPHDATLSSTEHCHQVSPIGGGSQLGDQFRRPASDAMIASPGAPCGVVTVRHRRAESVARRRIRVRRSASRRRRRGTTARRPAAATPASAAATGQGIGDPYYPDDGNLGYDVAGYHVRLDLRPGPTRRSPPRTTVTRHGRPSGSRRSTSTCSASTVDRVHGRRRRGDRRHAHGRARARHHPAAADRRRSRVRHRGDATTASPGVDGVGQVHSGWFDATTPGGGFIAGEPHSCTLWYPCNDHPTDKATFALTATVPRPFTVVSVGRRGPTTAGRSPTDGRARTYRWRLDEAVADLPDHDLHRQAQLRAVARSPTGRRSCRRTGPSPARRRNREAKLPEILDVLSRRLGALPGAGRPAASSSTATSRSRWRPTPGRSTPRAPTSTRSCTRTATSGGATTSRSSAGATSA